MAYPEIPTEYTSGLLLYGCAFNGRNDGQFFREAGLLDVDVVDHHGPYVRAMQREYPPEWRFHVADCLAWIPQAERERRWDIVSVDCPHVGTNALTNLMQRVGINGLGVLASKMLVFGAPTNWKKPPGATIIPRSLDFCWWVWQE